MFSLFPVAPFSPAGGLPITGVDMTMEMISIGVGAAPEGNGVPFRPERSGAQQGTPDSRTKASGVPRAAADGGNGGTEQPGRLTAEEQAEVKQLKATDRRVRAHEMAHIAAGAGVVTSGARFEYEKGPDGQLYAVGGEVSIDSSPVRGDPEATIVKAGKVRRAALAPSDPSAQDRRVAAQAAQMAAQARLELARSQGRENGQNGPSAGMSERNVAPFAEAAPPAGGSVDRIA